MAIQFTCDNCNEDVTDTDVITVSVQRPNQELVVNHADKECFDLAIKGDEEAVGALLLG
jgi:hypothetical protein